MSSLDALLAAHPEAQTFRFGDSAALSGQVLALVRAGRKTVTCAALAALEAGEEAMPEVGRRDIALDWDGAPAVMIETVEVLTLEFDAVSAELVADMGEFDDLAHFRRGYAAFFARNGGFDEKMLLLIERFRLVEDYGGRDV